MIFIIVFNIVVFGNFYFNNENDVEVVIIVFDNFCVVFFGVDGVEWF